MYRCSRSRRSALGKVKKALEFPWVLSARFGVFMGDNSHVNKLRHGLIQGLHLRSASGLDQRADLERLVLPDEVSNCSSCNESFVCGNSTPAIFSAKQGLRNNADQVYRKLHSNLLLLVGREDVNNSVNGLNRVNGMQSSKNKVPGFRGSYRKVDRFQVAHFADKDHVWVLPKNLLQRVREGVGVNAQFPLVDQRMLVGVDKLNWVLNRHDVDWLSAIHTVNHRSKRG